MKDWITGSLRDLRCALRSLLRDVGFFVSAVLIMGVGIGANTAVFSIANPLLMRPLPFEEPERLVWIANSGTGGMSAVTSRTGNLRDWRLMNESFESLSGYNAFFGYDGYNLLGDGEPQRLVGVGVARDFLDVLGVHPLLGRNFLEEEAVWNGRPAAILTHGFWERRYGADRSIVGRSISLNGTPTEVVGVLPSSFDFASTFSPGTEVDLLVPFPIGDETDRYGNTLAIVGRLKAGVSVEQAQAELDLINQRLEQAEPDRWGLGAVVTPLDEHIKSPFRRSLLVLASAVTLVLLIACANLSSLLLARSSTRKREMAVRGALGASRGRLVRQMLTESLVLAGFGALLGTALAVTVTRAVAHTTAVSIPLLHSASVDFTALTFTLLASVLAGLLFGILPALSVSRGRASHLLAGSSRGATEGRNLVSMRELLVVTEIALALVLLVGAGLLLRSFWALMEVDLGFRPESTVAWEIEPGRSFSNRRERTAFHERLTQAVARLPEVAAVGMSDTLPLGRNRSWTARAKGEVYEEGAWPDAFPRVVDGGYLAAMRIPLVAGRNLTAGDDENSQRVVLVNEALAQTLWPGRDPLGQYLLTNGGEWLVVGVVGNVRHSSLEESGGPEMYLSFAQANYASLQLVVRGTGSTESLVPRVRAALREAAPTLPTEELRTLEDVVDRAVSPRRFLLVLLGAFALTALALAGLGVFAVLTYSVSQRSREIGIRMALGASASRVRSRVVLGTLGLTAAGIGLGGSISFVLSRSIAGLLYGVRPMDPWTLGIVVLLMTLIAGAAAYLPARRASSIEPMSVLRLS